MIRPLMPKWMKTEVFEFAMECVGAFLLSGMATHWLVIHL